jgi:hypothetical protein
MTAGDRTDPSPILSNGLQVAMERLFQLLPKTVSRKRNIKIPNKIKSTSKYCRVKRLRESGGEGDSNPR